MVAKITGGSAGTCRGLADYLEKEVQGQWFSQGRSQVLASEVVFSIDENKKNLGKQEDKYYQVILSPSQSELNHIGNDKAKLEAYTRSAMNEYAKNFGKGIESQDLVWFAKIEQGRTYSHQDRSVQTGDVVRGQEKEGPQTHVHIIVSRTENLTRYQERKKTGELDRKNPLKLSPATHHRNTNQGAVKGGFDRTAFKQAAEQTFDRQFNYERPLAETFHYANVMDKGSEVERLAMRQAVQEQERNFSQRQQQGKQVEQTLTQSVAEQNTLRPQIEHHPTETVRPKLSDREELIKTLLERIDKPQQNQQRLSRGGLSL
ncbi:DUF5712 family protein [Spirosoma koreense]